MKSIAKLISLALALVATSVIIVRGHAGNSDPSVIHACVATSTGQVRIVGVDGVCKSAETPTHWSIVGPRGPQGEPGPQGAPATNPDPPCFDNVNRYVDCLNGTVTDTVTGLIWLKHNPRLALDYSRANEWAAGLSDGQEGLSDRSRPGDWRLPTKAEWDATMARAIQLQCRLVFPYVELTNDAGTQCWGNGPSTWWSGPVGNYMWTGTTDQGAVAGEPLRAWTVWVDGGSEGRWGLNSKGDGAWFVSPAVRTSGR